MKETNITELKNALEDSFQLVDIRDEGSVIYGMIPGAMHMAFKLYPLSRTF